MSRLKKFTLLELVVVISITIILLSFLTTSILGGREKARATGCVSNLRLIGKVAMLYQMNHSRVLPASFGDTSVGHVNHWINYLIQQGSNPKIFQCPSMAEDMMFDPAGYDPQTGNIYTKASYIMNIIQPNKWQGAIINSVKSRSSGWGTSSTNPVKVNQVANPSQTIYITDAISGLTSAHSGINDFRRTDHGITPTVTATGLVRWVGNHHEGGFHALFGDGRVKHMQKSDHNQWVAVPDH